MRPGSQGPEMFRRGFSLVEMSIVVVMIGILAALAASRYGSYDRLSAQATFINDIRIFRQAAEVYYDQTGTWLEDSSSGRLPGGWGPYVDADRWESATPIGGCWDFENESFGLTSAFGVHFYRYPPRRDDSYMVQIDAEFDDGDLSTGMFRKIAWDRYYCVMEE
jgi:prepilin-type N-terminal cleavage/methylation domain-containing protein